MFTSDELKKIMEYASDVTTSAMKLHHAVLKSDGAGCPVPKDEYLSEILSEASLAVEVYRKAKNLLERMEFAPPTGYQTVAANPV